LAEDSEADAEMTIRALSGKNLASRLMRVKDGAEAPDFLFRRGAYAQRGGSLPKLLPLDIKTPIAQFVRLETTGAGNRTLRIWGTGPYYLVESSVNNPGGTVLWFEECASVTVNVYASTFNGDAEVPADAVECHYGDSPNIVYLDVDPRTTGEMHPMFSDAG
jgi:hypothetical protein